MREQELFEWLKTAHFHDLTRSEHEYDGFDCQSEHYKLFIELKSRNTHYPDLLIEKKKCDYLIEHAEKLGLEPWYVNYTPEGVFAFALKTLLSTIDWKEKWLPSTTEFTNKSKTTKVVGFLPISTAVKLL